MRKIPTVMFSQHPDHASKPYFLDSAFIQTHNETEEAYRSFSELGADEMMWDWEGKLVDESVVERLLARYPEFFAKNSLGRDLFLTFRVPNPRVESGYRLGRAFMVILASQHLAHSAKIESMPLFEVILPMTESSDEMLSVQQSFKYISKAAHKSFGSNGSSRKTIEVIPIFESIEVILDSGKMIRKYIKDYKDSFKEDISYLRPFCARSDPALNSGIVPTTLAIKWALSEYGKVEEEAGIPMFPIIAPGALPFRGGLSPETSKEFVNEFRGVKTFVVQSSFRYDHPLGEVQSSIKEIANLAPKLKAEKLSDKKIDSIRETISFFERPYQRTVEKLAPFILDVSAFVPQRRERVQHIGLFGYSRQMGKIKLPRAIGFTCSCYSLGIPPEFFGLGEGIKRAKEKGNLKLIESLYRSLGPSLLRAGKYLRKESAKELGLTDFLEGIKVAEKYTGETFGPKTQSEILHSNLSAKIIAKIKKGKNPSQEIEETALLRKSVG